MGRYYSGEINGKFWFAVQSSDSADRFGVTGQAPSILSYYFDESNLEEVEEEIKRIEDFLGDKKNQLDEFFKSRESYSDEMLLEIGISEYDLSQYADLELGIKIRDCIIENGSCDFDAEC